MMAIAWDDVDLHKRELCVQQSDWKGHLTVLTPLYVKTAAQEASLSCWRVRKSLMTR